MLWESIEPLHIEVIVQIDSVQHTYGWYNDKRVVTEYSVSKHEHGNTVYHSQRWFYPVHIYNSKAKVVDNYNLGNNIDMRI